MDVTNNATPAAPQAAQTASPEQPAPVGGPPAQEVAKTAASGAAGAQQPGKTTADAGAQPAEAAQQPEPAAKAEVDFDAILAKLKTANEKSAKAALDSALKLAALPEAERAEAERAEREKHLEERENALLKRELAAEAKTLLIKNGLSPDLVSFAVGATTEDTAKRVEDLKAAFDAAVKLEVTKKLAGKTPPAGSGPAPQEDPFIQGFKGLFKKNGGF